MMTADSRPSATIYKFPSRATLVSGSFAARNRPLATVSPLRVAPVVFGANWYHDCAIAEERETGRN